MLSSTLSLLMYVGRLIGILAIQLISIAALLLLFFFPPLFVYKIFPPLWSWAENTAAGLHFWDDVGFVALVGMLGLIPFVFSKSVTVVPESMQLIAGRLLRISAGPWLPSWRVPMVRRLTVERVVAVWSTAKRSHLLIAGLVGVAIAVQLAFVLSDRTTTQRLTVTDGMAASELIDLRYDIGFGWEEHTMPVPRCPTDDNLDAGETGNMPDDTVATGGTEHPAQVEFLLVTSHQTYPSLCFDPY